MHQFSLYKVNSSLATPLISSDDLRIEGESRIEHEAEGDLVSLFKDERHYEGPLDYIVIRA